MMVSYEDIPLKPRDKWKNKKGRYEAVNGDGDSSMDEDAEEEMYSDGNVSTENESFRDDFADQGSKRDYAYRRARWFVCDGWRWWCQRFTDNLCGAGDPKARTVQIGKVAPHHNFPANVIRNQKYSILSFIPLVLFHQFKFFLNLYFLLVAASQFIPELRIGYLYTYWGPLGFVIAVTMCREAFDDFVRFLRDKEVNSQVFQKLTKIGVVPVPSSSIRVSDIILVEKNQRVPADMLLLRTSERNGSCFIRTDQLDGETDWKLRIALPACQGLSSDHDLFGINASIHVEKPQKDIHSFCGTLTRKVESEGQDPVNIENTLWTNTVVATGTALGIVIYTGSETRSAMNTSSPKTKVGLIDMELNNLSKVLFVATMMLALVMISLKGFDGPWYRYLFRFVLLFSYIIPLSLRVSLDLGKVVYSWMIIRDKEMPGTVVRSSTIPEELGRVAYLLTDKTGTLTQNEMVFKRLHLGTVSFGHDSMDEVMTHLRTATTTPATPLSKKHSQSKVRRTVVTRVHEAVKALALCHNVTPVRKKDDISTDEPADDNSMDDTDLDAVNEMESGSRVDENEEDITYQAASPDEVALVTWTETVGMSLIRRDLTSMTLLSPHEDIMVYDILQIFPFTSESKRMGIIVRDQNTGEITFYLKGADVVMAKIVQYNDWLEEECGNMAREGLRTLVVSKKVLTEEQYQDFEYRYSQAKVSLSERAAKVSAVQGSLESDMELLCLTGVEDKLQADVRPTLELLRNAGVKIWMLTGDKLETATCIAQSSRLVSKSQTIYTFKQVSDRSEAHLELNSFRRKNECAMVITGDSLETCLLHYEHEFMELACRCPAVVCCRCSPQQKAEIVQLLKTFTKKRTCAIGDGGNDVSMIQAANVGVGIEGKEGRQASLAADFSITQFKYLGRLLVWHGRNSYKRSAALSQFVIHRGLIISVMQAVFSSIFYFASVALYQGYLMVGYSTIYTMFPVFSLVLDEDVPDEIALRFPELYKDLSKGRSLSYKTFFIWILISIYQGGIIMFGGILLFEDEFIHVVSITFTSLILTELLMVALTIRTWHWLMLAAEVFSLGIYIASLALFQDYFDERFLLSLEFVWKVAVITLVSCLPLYILKFLRRKYAPPSYSKLT